MPLGNTYLEQFNTAGYT